MEYVLRYPAVNENWLRSLIESIKTWLLRKQFWKYAENDLLIN